jgi:hypothetical protein
MKRFVILVPILLLAAAGCGGTPTYPVEGKLVYKDGTPVTGGGQVLFQAADPNTKGNPRGNLQDDGSFRMGTFDDTDGVPEGRYLIAVVPTPLRSRKSAPQDWPPFQKKYMNHETSGLEFTVTRGNNQCPIIVEK